MRFPWVAALLVSLIGCAVGPDYRKPEVPEPNRFRGAGDSRELWSVANLPWWELLQDEELQGLIRVALAENKDLKRAVASVEQYQAQLMVSRMDYAPQVTGSANAPVFGRQTIFLFPGFPNPFNYYVQGNLNWEIDVWGRIRRANEAARADLFAQEENR